MLGSSSLPQLLVSYLLAIMEYFRECSMMAVVLCQVQVLISGPVLIPARLQTRTLHHTAADTEMGKVQIRNTVK